jgi:hypothetical protein
LLGYFETQILIEEVAGLQLAEQAKGHEQLIRSQVGLSLRLVILRVTLPMLF